MNIAYRFRIYPTEEQKILLGKTFGCCRFLYNQMLDDKIREYEKTKKMIKVDRFFPSSKKCCKCGRIKKELKLSERVYHCECGNEMDRDRNAAINIREEARRMLTA
ncbi:MAG: helix-turn-helix domain-containing protein [Anaerostipes hadrus]